MKKFKEFTNLLETPIMNSYWTKDKISILSDTAKQNIKDSTYPENKIDNNFYYKMVNGDHAYFNKNNDKVNAFSIVTKDNIHKLTHKGTDNAQQIHNFMIHHAEQHGSIKTDTNNTKGSKHLWTSLIKSKPINKNFHYLNLNTQEKVSVDSNNIDDVSDKIWGRHSKFNNIQLVMTHHDPA